MMKNRLTVAQAATLTLLTAGAFGPARGEEAVQPTPLTSGFEFCSAGPGSSGCVRFQGYIYVGRAPAGEAAQGEAGAPLATKPSLGEERLYIHAGGADAP